MLDYRWSLRYSVLLQPRGGVDFEHLPTRENFARFSREIYEISQDAVSKRFGLTHGAISPLISLPHQSVHYARGVPYATMQLEWSAFVIKLLRGVYTFDQRPADHIGPWEKPPWIMTEHWGEIGGELQRCGPTITAASRDPDPPMNIFLPTCRLHSKKPVCAMVPVFQCITRALF